MLSISWKYRTIDSSHNTEAMLEEELHPCFHVTHSPILEFIHAHLPQEWSFLLKKKTTFVEKAPLNSQWCWSRFSVFAKDHSQREKKKKCHKWLRSFQPSWNPWLPFTVWNLYGLNIYCWQISKSKLCFCRRNRKFLSGLNKE